MIAALIRWCVYNRVMVLLLSGVLVAAGAWAARNITVDAIPDLSDVQVVVRVDYAGQAPQVVQDQAVYPLTTALLAVPEAKVVRGYSMFGSGFVYVIFDDGTDLYWAQQSRARTALDAGAAAGGEGDARPRRDRRRLGLPVRAGDGRRTRMSTLRNCAASRTST